VSGSGFEKTWKNNEILVGKWKVLDPQKLVKV
jgi:hypothetical protein